MIKVFDKEGKSILCKMLIDSESQNNFVSEYLEQALKLPRKKVDCDMSGIGQTRHTKTSVIN